MARRPKKRKPEPPLERPEAVSIKVEGRWWARGHGVHATNTRTVFDVEGDASVDVENVSHVTDPTQGENALHVDHLEFGTGPPPEAEQQPERPPSAYKSRYVSVPPRKWKGEK